MGFWEEEYEKILITEEEYYKHVYRAKDDSLEEKMKELSSEVGFEKRPIYDKYGIMEFINETNKIIGYNYYKLGKRKMVYICGSDEFNKMRNLFE